MRLTPLFSLSWIPCLFFSCGSNNDTPWHSADKDDKSQIVIHASGITTSLNGLVPNATDGSTYTTIHYSLVKKLHHSKDPLTCLYVLKKENEFHLLTCTNSASGDSAWFNVCFLEVRFAQQQDSLMKILEKIKEIPFPNSTLHLREADFMMEDPGKKLFVKH